MSGHIRDGEDTGSVLREDDPSNVSALTSEELLL